jgi:hypothetical protein
MVFCGNCGLQLAPGSTTCPRCRAYTNVQELVEDPHLNDPTITSLRANQPTPLSGYPATTYPTSPQFPSQQTVLQPGNRPSQPGISNAHMPADQLGSQSGSVPTPGSVPPYAASGYTPSAHPIYSPFPGEYDSFEPQPPQSPQRRGRGILLLLLCLVVLLALGSTIVFVVKPDIVQKLLGNSITPTIAPTVVPTKIPTTSTSTSTPSAQARAVVVQLYNDINAHDYQSAWNLWGSAYQNSTTYTSYAAGYANTVHDELTINSITPQSNFTAVVGVTITATEKSASGGTVTSTYTGTYLVGQENGTWKLLSGNITKSN